MNRVPQSDQAKHEPAQGAVPDGHAAAPRHIINKLTQAAGQQRGGAAVIRGRADVLQALRGRAGQGLGHVREGERGPGRFDVPPAGLRGLGRRESDDRRRRGRAQRRGVAAVRARDGTVALPHAARRVLSLTPTY